MCDERVSYQGAGLILSRSKSNIAPQSKRTSVEVLCKFAGAGVRVNLHITKAVTECRFHFGPDAGIQRLTGSKLRLHSFWINRFASSAMFMFETYIFGSGYIRVCNCRRGSAGNSRKNVS